MDDDRKARRSWDTLMVGVALASLVPIVWVELRGLSWPDPTFKKLALIDLAFVAFFACEFAVRFARAPDKRKFLGQNWYDLLGLVPLYSESFAWLRAMRMLRVLRVIRVARAVHGMEFVGRVYRESHLGSTLAIAVAVVLAMASAFYLVEAHKNPAVHTWGDAAWWAIATTTTVGYGDIVPRTTEGRAIASALMVLGVGLFGVVASSLSTAIARVTRGEDRQGDAALLALLRRHEELVLRRARGELSDEEFEQAKRELLAIRGR